jgi:hypothetical protein
VKRVLTVLCLWACASLAASGRPLPAAVEEHAFLEMSAPRDAYFVQEPIRLHLRISFDSRFFETNAIQMFRRRLDVPVHVQADWFDDLPGTVLLEEKTDSAGAAGGERMIFALNDGLAEGVRIDDRLRDGRAFTVIEIERRFLPTRPGELAIPAPVLRFAFATRFEESLVNGRVPADRRDAVVEGRPLALTILPLPEEGRPPDFTGAVGQFTVRAEARPRTLKPGEILKLALHIEGDGNFGFFDPPRLDRLADFHVYGRIEDGGSTRLSVTYDLTPLGEEVREVPPIDFAYFGTTPPAAFRTIRTDPIPLVVRPLPAGKQLELLSGGAADRIVPGETDIFDLKPAAALQGRGAVLELSPLLIAGVLVPPWLIALWLLVFLRARERDRNDPEGVRARGAAAAFRAAAARPGCDAGEALVEYLAARLRCPAAAVIDPGLPARLEAAGVPADLAARSTALVEDLGAVRYGGGEAASGMEKVRELVGELEAVFPARGGRR